MARPAPKRLTTSIDFKKNNITHPELLQGISLRENFHRRDMDDSPTFYFKDNKKTYVFEEGFSMCTHYLVIENVFEGIYIIK